MMALDHDTANEQQQAPPLDEYDLRALREHADWVERATEMTSPYGGRLLSRGELDSWAGALRMLMAEVDRLRGGQ